MLFTDKACQWITGALFATVVFIHHFTRLRTWSRFIIQRGIIHRGQRESTLFCSYSC